MTEKKGLLIDPATLLYYAEDAKQSNYRVITELTEHIIPILKELELKEDQERRLFRAILNLLTQAVYTGRCLGGILTPNKTRSVDARPSVDEAVEICRDLISLWRSNE